MQIDALANWEQAGELLTTRFAASAVFRDVRRFLEGDDAPACAHKKSSVQMHAEWCNKKAQRMQQLQGSVHGSLAQRLPSNMALSGATPIYTACDSRNMQV